MNFLKTHQNKIFLALIFLVFSGFSFLLLYRLGIHPFIDWDESIYVQVAKEAWINKDFFDLTYFGRAWYEKPPAAFWIMDAFYAIGGVNEWTARLPVALAGIATVALSLRWVWEISKSYRAVLMAIASYYIMFPFITAAYFVNLDNIVGFFILLSLYSWWKSKDNHNWYWLVGTSIGLAVMTKNIVGLFPAVAILTYSLMSWDFAFLKHKKFWFAFGLGALIILPWHIYMSMTAGRAFWDNYLLYHVLKRFSSGLENNGAPFLYFVQIVFMRYYLALLVFGGSILAGVWLARKNKAIRFVVVTSIVIFLIFSSSSTKLPSYITAVLPLFVMLAGIAINLLIKHLPKVWIGNLLCGALVLVFIYTGYEFNNYKLVQGEFKDEYQDNKNVGLFLKDYRRELPVYLNYEHYKNLGIGYYAERRIIPTEDFDLIDSAQDQLYRTKSQSVFLGDGYIIIKR